MATSSNSMIRGGATAILSFAVPGGLPVTPCIQVRSNLLNRTVILSLNGNTVVSECGYSVFGTRNHTASGAVARARNIFSCHHPRKRVIQYSRDVSDRAEKPQRTGYPLGSRDKCSTC